MTVKILIADDSETIQKVVQLNLADLNCETIPIRSDKELLEFVKNGGSYLLLLDFCLSETINGYLLAEKVKKLNNKLKIMMMFGTFDPISDQSLNQVGVEDKIVKPFDPAPFKKKVQTLISNFHQVSPFSSIEEESNLNSNTTIEEESIVTNISNNTEDWSLSNLNTVANKFESNTDNDNFWSVDSSTAISKDEVEKNSVDKFEEPINIESEMESWGVKIPPKRDNDSNKKIQEKVHDEVIFPAQADLEYPDETYQKSNTDKLPDKASISSILSSDEFKKLVKDAVVEVIKDLGHKEIEKVAWEVIPDLAENLIKLELSKIEERNNK